MSTKEEDWEKQRKVVIKWLNEAFAPLIRALYYYTVFWQKALGWLKKRVRRS